jgi:hypothetical protein
MEEGCDAEQKRNGWGGRKRKEGGSQRKKKWLLARYECTPSVESKSGENRRKKIDDDEKGELSSRAE